MALDPAPITGTTSGGAEAYVPVVEPVSPAQLYHAPTPADRSSLTLAGQYMFVAMTTTLPNGAQLAKQLHDNYATTLDVEATEMLIAAMRYIYIYSRTESLRGIFREAESLRLLGLPPNLDLAQLMGTLARVISTDRCRCR